MFTKKLALILGLTVATAGCAGSMGAAGDFGLDTNAFGEWDADANAYLSTNEFETGIDEIGIYDTFDNNDDALLDENEFGLAAGEIGADVGAFGSWDLNDDSMLDETEFSEGLFGLWDENRDEMLAEPEFEAGVDMF